MSIPKYKSLGLRLTLWYTLGMGVIIALAMLVLSQGIKRELWDRLDESLASIAADVNAVWWRAHGVTWVDAIRATELKYAAERPLIQVIEFMHHRDREPKGASSAAMENANELLLNGEPVRIFRSSSVQGNEFLLHAQLYDQLEDAIAHQLYLTKNLRSGAGYPTRLFLLEARGPFVIQVGISLAAVYGRLRGIILILALAGILLLLLTSLLGFLAINRALQPVKKVVEAAHRISTDDLSLRIDSQGRADEIGALVDTFNEMIARLDKSVSRIKQFSGDVSHELRTPLTRIRGEVEVLLRKEREKEEYVHTLGSILEETEGLGRMIEDLLFLSRLDAGKGIGPSEPVALSELLASVCVGCRLRAEEKKVAFHCGPFPDLLLQGNWLLLERMAINIIDNAIRYTQPGGRVEVTLECKAGLALLCVQDSGIGIPPAALPFIFDRFYVVDASRSRESGGIGLGLAIAKSIADWHGAKIDIQSELGRGSSFTVRLPLAPAS